MIARVVASGIARAQTMSSDIYGVLDHDMIEVIIGEWYGKASETG